MAVASTAAPIAALPPAYRDRARSANPLVVAAGLWATTAIVAFGALVGAFTQVRSGHAAFFPADYAKKNYMPTMLFTAALFLLPVAEWLVWAIKRGERRQATQAIGLAVFLLAAMLNGLLYSTRLAEFGAGSSSFAVFFYAFYTLAGVAMVVALASLAVFGARLGTRQVSAFEPLQARATAIAVHVAAAGWITTWGALYAASK